MDVDKRLSLPDESTVWICSQARGDAIAIPQVQSIMDSNGTREDFDRRSHQRLATNETIFLKKFVSCR